MLPKNAETTRPDSKASRRRRMQRESRWYYLWNTATYAIFFSDERKEVDSKVAVVVWRILNFYRLKHLQKFRIAAMCPFGFIHLDFSSEGPQTALPKKLHRQWAAKGVPSIQPKLLTMTMLRFLLVVKKGIAQRGLRNDEKCHTCHVFEMKILLASLEISKASQVPATQMKKLGNLVHVMKLCNNPGEFQEEGTQISRYSDYATSDIPPRRFLKHPWFLSRKLIWKIKHNQHFAKVAELIWAKHIRWLVF